MIEASDREQVWRRLSHWVLWWKIHQAELEQQIAEYATLKTTASARGFSFLMSIITGMFKVLSGCVLLSHASDLPGIVPVSLLVSDEIIVGLLFAGLGFLVYRGKQWAMVELMALWSFDLLIEDYLGLRYWSYRADIDLLLVASLLAWTCGMHAYYFAFRIERVRCAALEAAVIAAHG